MGTLFIVSTPIGNLEDITVRALRTLFSVDVIACEDTRRTGQLMLSLSEKYPSFLNGAKEKPKFFSYFDQKEINAAPVLLSFLEEGKNVALVSDAGTPLISDPGYKIVEEALKHKISVSVVPGASAFLTALTGSGLPTSLFTFLGYLPEKTEKRQKLLRTIESRKEDNLHPTYICYCAPHKLKTTLEDMQNVFGDMPVVIGRELTKIHEEFFRGIISEAVFHFQNPKGECVILFQ